MSDARHGTRINCEIPITLTSLQAGNAVSEPCMTILVDPGGCALRFGHPLELGAAVRLEGLPTKNRISARVENCISLGEFEKFWIVGLALDEPGNVWGIETPPEDWSRTLQHLRREKSPSRFLAMLRGFLNFLRKT